MSTSGLCDLTATEAVALLRAGRVSPLEMVDAAAARIEARDGPINALPIRFFEVAREEARRFRHDGEGRPGWLAGLPMAIKDYNDVGGQLTTCGSPIFADHVAATDDITVATMRANGAIPLAKSNVPEFAGANTFNPVWGATRNPWNLEKSAGGSSGGAAAALAARLVWLANGSCLGGSLRIPASFCGVVGLRPSPGVVPRGVDLPAFDTLWVDGPLGRTVADVALLLDAQAGRSPRDPFSLPAPTPSFSAMQDRRRPPRRVGFSADLGLAKVDTEVAALCRAAVRRFSEAGAVVEETAPDFTGAIETFQTQRALLIAAVRGELLERHRARIGEHIIWNIEKGYALTAEQVIRADRQRASLFHRVAAFFAQHDVLALPTVAVPPFPVAQPYPTEIGGQKLESYIDWMFLTFVITLTSCPAISVPCGFTRDGLPVGLQLVGRPHGDGLLLGHARVLEDVLGIAALAPAVADGGRAG
ncbi:MAG TPA: amidase family protein [Vineibacter sp.]|nr:amidase family protein [Vineibacter sp.]